MTHAAGRSQDRDEVSFMVVWLEETIEEGWCKRRMDGKCFEDRTFKTVKDLLIAGVCRGRDSSNMLCEGTLQ